MDFAGVKSDPPEWLNDDFFLKVIREFEKDDGITLSQECKLRPGSDTGENFSSILYRTTVHYGSPRLQKEKSLDLIMKTNLPGDTFIFEKEIHMYSKVLPEMARLLQGIGEDFKYPRYIYGALEPHIIFIMEDVSGQKWEKLKLIGSFEEVKPMIHELAKFHAASVVLERDDKKFIADNYHNRYANLKDMDFVMARFYNDLIDVLSATDGFAEYVKPLKHFYTTLKQTVNDINQIPENYMGVLVHNDCHANNLLHQLTSDGHIRETMLIDYQICTWATPAIDLFFLLDILDEPAKVQHRDEIVHLYHTTFCDLLHRLGYRGKVSTLLDLQIELLRHGAFELNHYVVMYPFRYINFAEINIGNWMMGIESNPALKNEEYQRYLKGALRRFVSKGILVAGDEHPQSS